MIPSQFEYAAPASLNETLALLAKNPDAKALAGGHSLLPVMKLRLSSPSMLVDLRNVAELRGVSANGGGWRIGAMTTHAQIAGNADLKRYQALIDATSSIGDAQVRNRGTIGGSLAHADPAADLPAVVLALDATINATGSKGARSISIEQFFTGMLATALEEGEIITSVDLPALAAGTGSAYAKFANPASGYAMVGVAARVTLSGGAAQNVRVALTGAGDHAMRLSGVESALEGKPLTAESIAAACENAGAGLDLMGDIHASAEYRAAMVGVYARRALAKALERAG
ncbi:MAG TPA: xanthine dehydrogenase family protein subunit M [Roseiflexaceae bacterium]